MNVEALRNERNKLMRDARAISDSPHPSDELIARANEMLAEADRALAKITTWERAKKVESEINTHREKVADIHGWSVDKIVNTVEQEKKLIRAMMLGKLRASPEDSAEMERRFKAPGNAASTTSAPAGGYTIAPAYLAELLVAMKSQGSMRSVARVITTKTGAGAMWPNLDDRSQGARILSPENIQLPASADLVFGVGSLTAYTFVTDVLLISNQLMQDSEFDFDALVRDALAGRFVRGQNPYFTAGTGAGQPLGVVNSAALGVTGAAGSTASASVDNLLDLLHSVDPAYRPGAHYMMHDTTLQALRKLKDTTGRYIVQTGGTAGAPVADTLLGYPVVINQDMPVMAASAKSILFGNFDSYIIRDVQELQLIILRERYADANQTGMIGALRSDGRLLSAAQPIKYYQNSAT